MGVTVILELAEGRVPDGPDLAGVGGEAHVDRRLPALVPSFVSPTFRGFFGHAGKVAGKDPVR